MQRFSSVAFPKQFKLLKIHLDNRTIYLRSGFRIIARLPHTSLHGVTFHKSHKNSFICYRILMWDIGADRHVEVEYRTPIGTEALHSPLNLN